ncbi:CASC3/Barentsz eIF4AIII binding-domain-containing protein [Aspergillus pseudoustus]|uniref:CASC3/Barentsz eIF4AIII binding-domain-containing protein n=1 Tax=Aspergillus pseudoustus TaxID=1810923 RepID=A0ABR4J9P5_9EURO
MAPRRHNIGASRRRRREDEGEDEGSLDGAVEDDSLSEGSVISQQDEDDADGEGSDESEDDNISINNPDHHQANGRVPDGHQGSRRRRHSASRRKAALTTTVSDTDAMLNGLKIAGDGKDVAEIHFNDVSGDLKQPGRTPSAPRTETTREPLSDKKRREGDKTVKDKEADPTSVPKRGSFFLHDQRSMESRPNGHKYSKSKTVPVGLIVDGSGSKADVTTQKQWMHDLHDTVTKDDPPAPRYSQVPGYSTYHNKGFPANVRTAPPTTPPNREFGGSTTVGNVSVVVYLPGMDQPVSLPPIPKRQHTLLPQHRPPLRRDKPVRVWIPGADAPEFVFPQSARSFIFIPRAMRPNQQSYRGRGRGGFFGGRRPSIYASSTYTPSVAMSRRSSFGKPPSQDGYHSPAASVASRHTVVTTESGKPVVRLPPPRPPGPISTAPVFPVPPATIHPPPQTQTQQPVWRESRPAPIPMHQPRPQKAVSVADIETPASFPLNPPPTQQEQPFHHQVPYGPDASGSYPPPAHTAATPLSQIPERAVHAPPFQAYGIQPPQPYYPGPYQTGAVYYPVPGTAYAPYNNGGMGPGASFPAGQNVPYMAPGTHTPSEPPSQAGTVAHEEGGTVYYYDAPQMYHSSTYGAPSAGGAVGIGGMMAPGATYYYPQPQGIYYPPQ